MENNVFSNVEVPVLDDRTRIIHCLVQMGADKKIFENPSPKIGKRIVGRVLWILKTNGINMQSLGELTAEQLKTTIDGVSCEVQVDSKTGAVTMVEAHNGKKSTKKFEVDKHENVIEQSRVTSETETDVYKWSRTYDKNGIMMKNRYRLETKGKGDTTVLWERDEEFPFVAHMVEKSKGKTKEYYVPLNLYEMHDVTSSEKNRDEDGNPINDSPIIIHNRIRVGRYYRAHEKEIKSAFSEEYKSTKSLYHKGLKEIAIKAGILPPEKGQEFTEN